MKNWFFIHKYISFLSLEAAWILKNDAYFNYHDIELFIWFTVITSSYLYHFIGYLNPKLVDRVLWSSGWQSYFRFSICVSNHFRSCSPCIASINFLCRKIKEHFSQIIFCFTINVLIYWIRCWYFLLQNKTKLLN